jgi:hypoxanthine phosphoribosyltransferase
LFITGASISAYAADSGKRPQFELYLPESQLEEAIIHMAQEIQRDLSDKDPCSWPSSMVRLCSLQSLMRKLSFPCRISFVKLASYSGTQSTEQVNQLIGLNEGLAGQHVVISGRYHRYGTYAVSLLDVLKEKNPASVRNRHPAFQAGTFRP